MKKEKVGITILILFITITTSINILSLNKSSKLLGTIPSRNIDSNEVDYTENKSVQGAINDLAEKANIIGTDEEKNKFRDDSKTLISEINGLNSIVKIKSDKSGYGKEVNTTNPVYLGTKITIPENYSAILIGKRSWHSGKPNGVWISSSSSSLQVISSYTPSDYQEYGNMMLTTTTFVESGTYYLWSSSSEIGKTSESLTAIYFKNSVIE